ncbi:hypothetical protein [Paraclostridium sordellii]|uniref:hypothetical protein n=1 Tax=Paraclostridium sordellii TaxID=1505 RepID=UPI0005EA451F|nr:hypothetical protein [Paeniclostridium sordellii]CEQ27117.1 TMP repeat family [[Clostridium] sordellii] [Paeniclostridium sordellii]
MSDTDSVGKITLDLEVQGDDLGKQIEKMTDSIGVQINKSLSGISKNFDGNSITKGISESVNRAMRNIDESINSSVKKNKSNILKNIEELKSKALENIKNIMANAKNVKIPMKFSPTKEIPMTSQTNSKVVNTRGPPNKVSSINMEGIKSKIENLSSSLDITNRSIEQQQEKLLRLRETYNSTFSNTKKNRIEEQILKTESSINKLIAKSDKTGFKLADLDREFERLSNSSKNSASGMNQASNSMNKLSNVIGRVTRNLKNASNSTQRYRQNMNGARSSTRMFIRSMFMWGMIFPVIMKGISAVAGYIGSALMTNAQFSNSLQQIRTNLIVAFMPIYQAVLPALNALMSALATVTAYIAAFVSALFGKTYQASFGAAKNMNASIASMKSMEKQGKKTSGAIDKIGDSAEKTKKKIQRSLSGFDEINKLNDPNDDKIPKVPKGGGGGGGIDPIPMVAPNIDLSPTSVAMQKINSMVEKLKDIISKIFQPFKNAWAREGAETIASIKHALHGIWELIKSIGRSFLQVWTNGTGEAILVVILQILQNIFNIIGDIAITFANAWNAGGIGTAIVQSLANTFLNLLTIVKKVGDSFREVWGEVGPRVASTFMEILKATSGVLENLSQKLVYVWDNGGSHLFQGFIKLGAKVFELAGYIYVNFVAPMVNWFVNAIAPVIAKVADVVGTVLDAFSNLIGWLLGEGKPVLDTIITVIGSLIISIKLVKGALKLWTLAQQIWTTVSTISTTATTVLGTAIAFLTSPIGIAIVAIGAIIAIGIILYKNWDFIKAKAIEIWGRIKDVFNNFKEWLKGVFQRDWSKSFGALGNLLNAFLRNVSNIFSGVKNVFKGIIDFVAGVFTGNWSRAWNGVKEIFKGAFQCLTGIAKAPLNGVIGLINMAIDGLNSISFTAPSWVPFVGGKHFGVHLPKMPYLAKGGIIDKPTQAVVGEAGTEAVVPLENNTGGLNLLANKLSERINNMLMVPSNILQQPSLTMLGQDIDDNKNSLNNSEYLDKLKEAIVDALKEVKGDNNYSNTSDSDYGESNNVILKVSETDFGKVAIKAINKVNKQAGVQLLDI